MISGRLFAMLVGAAVLVCATTGAFAQSIVSVKSGAVHHVEGRAFIDNKEIQPKLTEFPNLNEGSVLKTERGRVEMLLTPGVIIRMAEDSSLRMISNKLSDTRLEILEGSALVEAMEILKENAVSVISRGITIELLENGLYRIDADPAQLRVYDGKAKLTSGDETLTAKKGRVVDLDGPALAATKFDSKKGDSLYRWSYRRSGYLSMANLSAAKSINDWGMPLGSRGGWYWNPYFGMFTFIPANGLFHSPFGFSYWSPTRVYYAYYAPRQDPSWAGGGSAARGGVSPVFTPDRGYSGMSRGTAAASGGAIGSGSVSSAPAASSAPVSRGGSDSGSRGSAGGSRGR